MTLVLTCGINGSHFAVAPGVHALIANLTFSYRLWGAHGQWKTEVGLLANLR